MQTATWFTRQDYLSTDLIGQPPGEYLLQAFDTPTGLPNSSFLLTGAVVDVWMDQPVGTTGFLFPEAKLFLNGPSGTPVCTMTNSTALESFMNLSMRLSCNAASGVPVSPSDRYYLWIGFQLTATPTVSTQVDMAVGAVRRGFGMTDLGVFLAPLPTISSVNPAAGPVGTQLTITGSNFGATQGTRAAQLGTSSLDIIRWSDSAIFASVPPGASTGNVVVTNGGYSSNSASFTVTQTPGALFGAYSSTVTSVTLTSPSVTDWAHWGASPDAPLVTRSGIFTDFTVIGAGTPTPFSDGEIEYSWTDGDIKPAADRTKTGVSITGVGNGFHLTVPASSSPQTLLLYIGVWEAQGRITASLSDNAAAPFTDVPIDIVAANGDHHANGTYALTFQAGQPGQTLSVDYVMAIDHGTANGVAGYVSLQSAVLAPALPNITLISPPDNLTLYHPSDVSVAAVASQIGAPITTVSVFSDGQKLFDATAPPYTFTVTDLGLGDHIITTSTTDANGLTSFSNASVITEWNAVSDFSGIEGNAVATDLSVNASDWVHWGGTVPDRRAGVAAQISNFTTLSNGSAHSFDAAGVGGVPYSWSSGTPTDIQAGTSTQMQMQGFKNGFTFTIPVDTTIRLLNLFIASGYGEVTLRASLSDGSAAPYVRVFSTPAAFNERNYSIVFQAASAGQKLTISGQVTRDDGFAYIALESATVEDFFGPHVDSITPSTATPGTQITITGSNFGDPSPGSAVSLNGVSMNVISWTDSSITAVVPPVRSGPVVVSRGLANSNGMNFVVILPPPPAISFISPTAGVAGTLVTISGSNFGQTQGSGTIIFNGLNATPNSWTDSTITVPAPPGVHSGPVVVSTISGPSNGAQFTFAPGIRFALQNSYITPDEAALEVGSSRTFILTDPSGSGAANVTWSVDNSTLATIQSSFSNSATAKLQGLAPGEVTITAASALGTVQAKATIYPVGGVPVSTAAWAFYPQTQNGGLGDFSGYPGVKAKRYSPQDPYLYLPGFEGDVANLNALDQNGNLKWRITIPPANPDDSFNFPINSAGTDDGGLLLMTGECCGSSDNFNMLYRFRPDGTIMWTYKTATDVTFPTAIGPDGTIYFWSEGDNTNNFNSPLIALNDDTGTESFRYQGGLPSSRSVVSSEQPDPNDPNWKPCADYFPQGQFVPPLPASGAGEHSILPIIGTDGNVYIMETGENISYNYSKCHVTQIVTPPGQPLAYFIDSMDGQMQYSASVGVAQITPVGGVQHFVVNSVSWSGEAGFGSYVQSADWKFDNGASQLPQAFFRRIAPDGQGGMLLAWGARSSVASTPQLFFLSRLLNGSPSYSVPLPADAEMATNLQGTAFFADTFAPAERVRAVDVASGTPKWDVTAFAFLGAGDNGGAMIVNGNGTQEVDQNGNLGDSAAGTFPDAYLDPGVYSYLSRDFGELVVLKTPLKTTISNGFAIPQKGHTANQIGPLSPAKFRPFAECSGFDGDDQYGLIHGALMVPAGGSNKLVMANTSAAVLLVPKDPTLISSISPDFVGINDQNLTITVTAAPGKTGGTWINFQSIELNKPIGKAFYVVIYPKVTKSLGYFKVVAPASGSFPELAPDDTFMPTQADLETFMNNIYETQANVHFNVSGPITLSSAYDFAPQDGALLSQSALSFSDPWQEAKKIQADSAAFTQFDRKVFFVRKIKSIPDRIGGFSFTPDDIAASPSLPSGAFVDQFVIYGPHTFGPFDESENPFPAETIAHEIGHTFGLYPGPGNHYPDAQDHFHLMSVAPDFSVPPAGSAACEINFFEWQVLHGQPLHP